jgi:hypothetical protein
MMQFIAIEKTIKTLGKNIHNPTLLFHTLNLEKSSLIFRAEILPQTQAF